MKRITLLSDTHGELDKRFFHHFKESDEIWHAGDIGSIDIIDSLNKLAPVKAVFGNIDNHIIRRSFKQTLLFKCEKVNVMMTHIGGYPGNYAKGIKDKIKECEPKIFICGHSHILKVIYDKKLKVLHMNPGAVGNYGIHKVKTIIKFIIEEDNIKDLKIIEFPRKN
ncbi:MAG: metallophosphoesterase family protein [Flavobacteriales bacterium]|jgi:putative phosphoesterase|tara:strand:+ start:43 stop:540 length:498 start_codon:yes stop_codon:yes gene_type:complete